MFLSFFYSFFLLKDTNQTNMNNKQYVIYKHLKGAWRQLNQKTRTILFMFKYHVLIFQQLTII